MTKSQQEVAIVGMALRVPGASDLEQFWTNLMDGRDCLRRSSLAELERSGLSARVISDPSFVAAKPLLDGIEYFDSGFFGISKSQAEIMDPTHRMFLECVWEAMEHGGIVPGDNAREVAGIRPHRSFF